MDLSWLWTPLLACLVLTGMHAYLGVHVLARGVIFVDLALAQVAALGAAAGLLLGLEPGTDGSHVFALLFTLAGAGLLSTTRVRRAPVPQEAVIGIVYAVAWASMILVMSVAEDAHGVEKIRSVLTGRSIVWVTPATVLHTAIVYAAVALLHFLLRRPLMLVSFDAEEARRRGMRLGLWDFVFYATFGIVITSSVQIAGVLLVFCFLIVPAVIGALLASSLRGRLAVGWVTGLLASLLGLLLGYELPTGPAIVVCFGALAVLAVIARTLRSRDERPRVLRRLAAVTAGGGVLLTVVSLAPWTEFFPPRAEHPVPHAPGDSVDLDTLLRSEDVLQRQHALDELHAHPDWPIPTALLDAARVERDPDLRTHLIEEGLRRGDGRFLELLVDHVLALRSPFHLEEAIGVLVRYTDLELTGVKPEERKRVVREWFARAKGRLAWDAERRRFAVR